MFLMEVCLSPRINLSKNHTPLLVSFLHTLLANIHPSVSHISLASKYLHPLHIRSLPSGSIFFKHIPVLRMSQLTTHERYIFSIHGARMPSKNSKTTRIHGNTISTIGTHQLLVRFLKTFFSFFSTQYGT